MKKILLSSVILGSALLLGNSFTYAEKLKVKPEVFQPTKAKSQSTAVQLRSVQAGIHNVDKAKNIALPVLSSQEISKIKPATKKRPIQIGVNRSLSTSFPDSINLAELDWQTVAGGKVAHIIITSEQAVSLRVNLDVVKIADGTEIRFFSPNELEKKYAVFTAKKIR